LGRSGEFCNVAFRWKVVSQERRCLSSTGQTRIGRLWLERLVGVGSVMEWIVRAGVEGPREERCVKVLMGESGEVGWVLYGTVM
jgi:hypothetical protein